jgi:hypothetical protein
LAPPELEAVTAAVQGADSVIVAQSGNPMAMAMVAAEKKYIERAGGNSGHLASAFRLPLEKC